MTPKMLKLASVLLNLAADEFANHGCNDMDETLLKAIGFTAEEKQKLAEELSQWNEGRPDPEDPMYFEWIGDHVWMRFLAWKLDQMGAQAMTRPLADQEGK